MARRWNSKLGSLSSFSGYYRTPSGHAVTQQQEFEKSLQNLKDRSSNNVIILGGDFNFRDVDWETESVAPGSYERTASQMLIDSLADHHLSQMQRETTCESSVLDLYITNRPTLVKTINTVPNISDHEGAVLVDSNIKPVH